jgi:transposase
MERTSAASSGQIIYVGIDVHLRTWSVSIFTEFGHFKSFQQDACAERLMAYLRRRFPGAHYRCVYEAGFSGFSTQRALEALGADCIVVAPADVASTQKERVVKRDKTDALKLARALKEGVVVPIGVPSEEEEGDRDLVRVRDQHKKKVVQTKNRIKALLYRHGIAIPSQFGRRCWSRRFICWVEEVATDTGRLPLGSRLSLSEYLTMLLFERARFVAVSKQVASLMKTQPNEAKAALIRSVPGVGPQSAATVLTELYDAARFVTEDRLACYCGLTPSRHGSGDKERDGSLIRRCNKRLRHVLIESAWMVLRYDPELLALYHRLKLRMPAQKAIIRIARKQLRRIRAVLVNQTPFVSRFADA